MNRRISVELICFSREARVWGTQQPQLPMTTSQKLSQPRVALSLLGGLALSQATMFFIKMLVFRGGVQRKLPVRLKPGLGDSTVVVLKMALTSYSSRWVSECSSILTTAPLGSFSLPCRAHPHIKQPLSSGPGSIWGHLFDTATCNDLPCGGLVIYGLLLTFSLAMTTSIPEIPDRVSAF